MWLSTYTYIGVQGDFRKVQKMEETKIDTIFNKGMYYAWLCTINLLSTYICTCILTRLQSKEVNGSSRNQIIF